ncbi:hypothetical protein QFZ82_007827 [Streptomyces sp. V4I23]|uniref:hypothetical protein n=1 Tax=Streptomyces sp. V4I23 TaxID=3042282 RepID=UPI00277E0F83|nr:hypothetical protein [Streptomyces sp. V4I23]MDQ1013342.1 hypothetical protein [Streptomyces sp. V4I23]
MEALATAEVEGRQVAVTGNGYNMLHVWDLTSRDQFGCYPKISEAWLEARIGAVAVGKVDGQNMVVAGVQEKLCLSHLATGKREDYMIGHVGAFNAVAVGDLHGQPNAVTSDRHDVRMWDWKPASRSVWTWCFRHRSSPWPSAAFRGGRSR